MKCQEAWVCQSSDSLSYNLSSGKMAKKLLILIRCKQGYSANNIINLLGLLYYLPNILEMTGCFNSAYSAIIQEKWMLFAYFYYVQSSFIKLDSLFLGFLFLIVIAVKELFPIVFRFGTAFFNVATFRTAGSSFF